MILRPKKNYSQWKQLTGVFTFFWLVPMNILHLGSFFLKDTKKYFGEVEAQTWYHQTAFCIVYLTKIQTTDFFLVFLRINYCMFCFLRWSKFLGEIDRDWYILSLRFWIIIQLQNYVKLYIKMHYTVKLVFRYRWIFAGKLKKIGSAVWHSRNLWPKFPKNRNMIMVCTSSKLQRYDF